MIFGKIDESMQLSHLLQGEAWKLAFDWLSELSEDSVCGSEERLEGKLKIGIDSYSPKPLDDCRFESHREFVDVQFSLLGGELIHYLNYELLDEDGIYDSSRDVQFYKLPAPMIASVLRMKPMNFAVFFPEDAHCPQVVDGENTISKKAVLKIHRSLLR
jgi:YhcH/YjgK/YiaL family protein